MKTLNLNDEQHALLVSLLQGDIIETEQMIEEWQPDNKFVSKEELQDYLASSEALLIVVEGA